MNNAEIADIRNALGGPGETRLADIEVRVREGFGQLRMKGRVEDLDDGLKAAVAVTGPAEITTQTRHQFIPGVPLLAVRNMNSLAPTPTLGSVGYYTGSSENPAAAHRSGGDRSRCQASAPGQRQTEDREHDPGHAGPECGDTVQEGCLLAALGLSQRPTLSTPRNRNWMNICTTLRQNGTSGRWIRDSISWS